jgi:hypothetical protein
MKNSKWLGIALFTVLGATTVGYAQRPYSVRAEIPFDFTVGRATLPAGQYVLNGLPGRGFLSIEGENRRTGVLVVAHSGQRSRQEGKTKLIFHRYGERYFLSGMWYGGDRDGFELPKSKAERELAKITKNTSPSEEVVVLASAR